MVIEKLRQHAKREAAAKQAEEEATKSQRRKWRQGFKARSVRRSNAHSGRQLLPVGIVAHPYFVPGMAVWGAAVAGLSTMMLHSYTIARLAMITGLGALGSSAQLVFAVIAAAIGAVLVFGAVSLVRPLILRRANQNPIAIMSARRVRPIDPGSELGSESLDAPFEEMPFSREQAQHDAEVKSDPLNDDQPKGEMPLTSCGDSHSALELDASSEIGEDFDTAGHDYAPLELTGANWVPQEDNDEPPLAMDLGEFASLEGREAVWVEGPIGQNAKAPSKRQSRPAAKASADQAVHLEAPSEPAAACMDHLTTDNTAIEDLRQVPPQDLSLVQMIERFAAALHENQEAVRALASEVRSPGSVMPRDTALAEAIKALSLFTERGFDAAQPGESAQAANIVSETEQELRAALAKLQDLRGAA